MVRQQGDFDTGLLDGGYFPVCGGFGWCWRMHRPGWRLFYCQSASGKPHGRAGARQFHAQSFLQYERFYGPLAAGTGGLCHIH